MNTIVIDLNDCTTVDEALARTEVAFRARIAAQVARLRKALIAAGHSGDEVNDVVADARATGVAAIAGWLPELRAELAVWLETNGLLE